MKRNETPKQAFEIHKKSIEASLAQLNLMWANEKARYEEKLKDFPDNWSGIGRGSDLADLEKKLLEILGK